MTGLNVDPRAVFEMNRAGDAIGCLYVAAVEFDTRPCLHTWVALLRTRNAAQKAGVDNSTITQTSQLARQRKEEDA